MDAGRDIRIVKLTKDILSLVGGFDCGDADLNEFLQKDALRYYDGKIAVSYVLVSGGRVVGFFCLSNDAVEIRGRDKRKLQKEGKAQKTYPSIKIGRFAVDKARQHAGVGSYMIETVIGMALEHSLRMGCRYLTVDAYNKEGVRSFYLKNRFEVLREEKDKPVLMYLDIKRIQG